MLNKSDVSQDDIKAAPSMLKRLSGKKMSVICYSTAVLKDGRSFSGSSQMFQTAAGHAERQSVKRLCENFNINFQDGSPDQMKLSLAAKVIKIDYLYVDFEPCVDCEPWLEALVGSEVPVYYLEDFPYQELTQVQGAFQKAYTKFQEKYFGDKAYLEDAQLSAEKLRQQQTKAWRESLQTVTNNVRKIVENDLEQVAVRSKAIEQRLTNIIGDGANTQITDAIQQVIPWLGYSTDYYLGNVNITYNNTVNIPSHRISCAVLRVLIVGDRVLQDYANNFQIPLIT